MMVNWIGISRSKYYDWQQRYGRVNEHNGWIPRDCWLTEAEKQAIIAYYHAHPLDGYRRLTYMMMDADIVAVSDGWAERSSRPWTWPWLRYHWPR